MSSQNGTQTTEEATAGQGTAGQGTADRPPRPVVRYRDGWQDRVPGELKALRQWVVWQYEWRDGKPAEGKRPATAGAWTKVLYQPEAPVSRAMSNQPRTWGSFPRAVQAFDREPEVFAGVGFVFSERDPFCGVDLDACLDADGNPLPWAADLLALLSGTYAEVSPSGRGVKAYLRATLGDRKGSVVKGRIGPGAGPSAEVGIYDRRRFFAVTGETFGGSSTIANAMAGQEAAEVVYAQVVALRSARDAEKEKSRGKRNGHAGGKGHAHLFLGRAPADDAELLRLARSNATNGPAFSALYDHGDTSGYGSDSEADAALCCHLAFWAQKDAPRIDGLWLNSALGRRAKVQERPDYRAVTIATAIERTQNVYRPIPRPPIPAEATQAARPIEAADQFPWTDRGLAERLVKQYGHLIRYCVPWRKWLVWDGCRWATDDTLAIDRYLKATIRALPAEAATIAEPEARDAFLKWAMACESKKAHEAALRLAMGEEGVPIVPRQLDADPWLLNVQNGTIDLRTGQLRPHRRSDLISKVCPVDYHADADAPLWDSILRRFLVSDDIISWVDRLLGYVITGVIRQHVLPVWFGTGANGKSTILNTLLDVLGDDYGMKAPPDLLLARGGDNHPTERASLFGKRLVVAIETEDGRRFNESMVKELTGGDRITARRMREDFWSFSPSHKLILATNHRPGVKGGDNGIWRRLKMIDFRVSLRPEEQDTSIPDRLRDEAPGILARCVRNCLIWQNSGFPSVASIEQATAEYREDEDVLKGFIEDCCEVGPEAGRVAAGSLYGSYKGWAEFNGYAVMSAKRFGKSIVDRGFERAHSGGKFYVGIDLKRGGPIIPDDDFDGGIDTF